MLIRFTMRQAEDHMILIIKHFILVLFFFTKNV